MGNKANRLYWVLGAFFLTNALLAEFVGGKIFSLERTLGFEPISWDVLGIENLSFSLTAGVLMWPVVFVMTDIINEYYGHRGVRFLSYLASGLIAYAFVMIYAAIGVTPADFWATDPATGIERDVAFRSVLGQGMWIIVGSLAAFLLGQIVDVLVFQWLRRKTGARFIWLRATGSTLVSQFVDSFVVLFIAFYVSGQWDFNTVMAICIVNYTYKGIVALAMTPVLYGVHSLIDKWLGEELANQLKTEAARRKE